MSVLQNINGSLYRMDASDLAQLAAVEEAIARLEK